MQIIIIIISIFKILALLGLNLTGQLEVWTGKVEERERERRTRSKEPHGGIKPKAAAARTQPLSMGLPPTQLQGCPTMQVF